MLPTASIHAISSANFVVNLTLALVMVHTHFTRRVYPGFSHWMASQIVLAMGMVLLSLRTQLSPWAALALGNSLLMFSQVLIYSGLIRFFNLTEQRVWPSYLLLAASCGGFVWLIANSATSTDRSLLFSLFTALIMMRIASLLLMHPHLRRDPVVRLLIFSALFLVSFFGFRSLVIWQVQTDTVFWDQQLLAAAFFVGIIFSIIMVFGFLQLMQARIEEELQEAQAQTEQLANTDRLTGAWNRRRFEREAAHEMMRARRHRQPLSVILFDIDNFKLVNDRYGHQTGDEILAILSELVRQRIRRTDALIRWGGDEFLILTPMTSRREAQTLAEALCNDIASFDFNPVGELTLSMGVAEYQPGESLESWLIRADRSLYTAKAQGRNQVVATVFNQ